MIIDDPLATVKVPIDLLVGHESKLDITELDIIKANTTFRCCQKCGEVLSHGRLFDMSHEEQDTTNGCRKLF